MELIFCGKEDARAVLVLYNYWSYFCGFVEICFNLVCMWRRLYWCQEKINKCQKAAYFRAFFGSWDLKLGIWKGPVVLYGKYLLRKCVSGCDLGLAVMIWGSGVSGYCIDIKKHWKPSAWFYSALSWNHNDTRWFLCCSVVFLFYLG